MRKEGRSSIVGSRAIIFDLDGTLLDTLDDIADSVNRMLNEEGLPTHTVDAYRFFIGDGWRMLVSRALPEDQRSDERIEFCSARSREIYHENWNRKTRAYAGIADLMEGLQEKGIPRAVLSNNYMISRCDMPRHIWVAGNSKRSWATATDFPPSRTRPQHLRSPHGLALRPRIFFLWATVPWTCRQPMPPVCMLWAPRGDSGGPKN